MIILILAIIVALLIFSLIRALFIPFLIIMVIGFVVGKVEGVFGSSNQPSLHVATTEIPKNDEEKTSSDRPIKINTQQKKVCSYFSEYSQAYLPLEDAWQKAENQGNKIAAKIIRDPLRGKIDNVFNERNKKIASYLGREHPRIKNWSLYVKEFTYTDDMDGGSLSADLISPCSPEISVKIFLYTPKKDDLPVLAKISKGSVIVVSGDLLPKHEDEGLTPDNIEWGGSYLWGGFGDLAGHDVFMNPEFDIHPTSFQLPSTP
ncbi:hypothetical protein [Acetobacter sp. P1H12_c]|uniref:hypothetical protein n=1 Tax=Acetobacter sp. P1H12_c TaxID=2762621 RepID=UPI001C043F9B|nr:hypothetical protein [Acetobacter sp. P1H12_c]